MQDRFGLVVHGVAGHDPVTTALLSDFSEPLVTQSPRLAFEMRLTHDEFAWLRITKMESEREFCAELTDIPSIGIAGFTTKMVVVVGDMESLWIDQLRQGMQQANTIRATGDSKDDRAGDLMPLQKALQVMKHRML